MRGLALFACFAAACAADRGLEGQMQAPQSDPPVATQSLGVCLTDGTFGFHVYGDGLAQWNGDQIVATALEPQQDLETQTTSMRVPVRLGTKIADGSFSLSCPSGLEDNSYYPSYALFVDLNGDARCDEGDVGLSSQRYGWDAAIEDQIGVTADWETFQPVADLQPAIGASAQSFCGSFFPN